MQLKRRSRRGKTLVPLALAALALPFVAPAAASAAVPQSPPGWSRDAVMKNAQRWVDQRVPYSQTSWYRGYRQDCSGFVSMAWNIHCSYPTGMMSQIASPVTKDALLPGDVLLNNSSRYAHVVLFVKWAYTDKSWYWGYEQLSSTNRPVKRLIPYPYFRHAELYVPYRFTRFPPTPGAKEKAAAKPSSAAVESVAAKPAARKSAARPSPAPVTRAHASPAWQLAFATALAAVGGLAWHFTGRFLG